MADKKWLLGYTKKEAYGSKSPIFLRDFKWYCGWYWAGGYIGNRHLHCHFDGCFLNMIDPRGHSLGSFSTPWNAKTGDIILDNGASCWESIETFLDDVPEHISSNWWRIKDLFSQFYKLSSAAGCFKHGGNITSQGRLEAEIDVEMAAKINKHIETVIIPAIRDIMDNKPASN